MRKSFLLFAAAAAALAAEPAARLSAPVLGYVFDSASKSMRSIAGVPGAAALEGAIASASKLEIGFVSQNHGRLIAATLEGAIFADLATSSVSELPGAPAGIVLGAWSADSGSFALWSRSGDLQVWTNSGDTPSLRFAGSAESVTGLAVANNGNSVLYWSESGLFLLESGGLQQLVNEPVFGAAVRGGTGEWAAVTASQLLRSNSEPVALPVSKPAAVAFSARGVIVAGEKAIGIIDESGSRILECDCSATALERLSGRDVFRLTGLDASSIAIYDGDSPEARIVYIPTEGGRR